MMDNIKIRKAQRMAKRERKLQDSTYCLTPPRSQMNRTAWGTVWKWQKKYGYDYDDPQHKICPYLKKQKQQFADKAAKYCGSRFGMVKKQTRFDKMRMKEQLGFQLKEIPIKSKFRRVDRIVTGLLKKQALFALMACR